MENTKKFDILKNELPTTKPQDQLQKRKYSGWKRPDLEIQQENPIEIPEENYVIPADTSVESLLSQGVIPQVTKNYSGDILDLSSSNIQEIKSLSKALEQNTNLLKADAEKFDMEEKKNQANKALEATPAPADPEK